MKSAPGKSVETGWDIRRDGNASHRSDSFVGD
jgi:hypothetical protein